MKKPVEILFDVLVKVVSFIFLDHFVILNNEVYLRFTLYYEGLYHNWMGIEWYRNRANEVLVE